MSDNGNTVEQAKKDYQEAKKTPAPTPPQKL